MQSQSTTPTSRTVLITGSSRGIGLGTAKCFATNGDTVILSGCNDSDALEQAVEEVTTLGKCASCGKATSYGKCVCDCNATSIGKCAGYMADLSDYNKAREMFSRIQADFGPLDVLVNNAGAAYYGLFADMHPSDWQSVLADNLLTQINTTHLAVPAMVRAKSGCIINITSVWGISGASCEVMYSAAKAAVIGFTKSLAKELGPSGVRVNAIACGTFDTRMIADFNQDEKADILEDIPLGRFGYPSDAGELAVFLASAGYITGQIVGLDGGFL